MKTIIIKPLITETSMKDAATNKFTFSVFKDATKTEIKKAVEKTFNVHVVGVTTVNLTRRKTIFTKFGRKKSVENIKKARVELEKGQTIPAFEIDGKKEDSAVKKEKKVKSKKEEGK
ncbi:MAG: 50S ribosomal protein L23 [Candidatus Levybacteria bacterium]|nr:50S ribosomal protein L23 [Candidatus Levybacteria bacterium]MBP9814858.1 50S ribosomal protein L23 [Candidatus Levybacteria bacterium]